MRIAKIQNRYGVKGYAGGYKWCTRYIEFKNDRKVAEAGLEFLKLMDARLNIEPRPTIFLLKMKQPRLKFAGEENPHARSV